MTVTELLDLCMKKEVDFHFHGKTNIHWCLNVNGKRLLDDDTSAELTAEEIARVLEDAVQK